MIDMCNRAVLQLLSVRGDKGSLTLSLLERWSTPASLAYVAGSRKLSTFYTINIWGDHFQSITIPEGINPTQLKIDGGPRNSDAGLDQPGSHFDFKLPPLAHLI